MRCVHEASLWPHNCFLTLTYDEDHLPQHGSLYKPDYQNFLKALRRHVAPTKIRYYMCGEYGEFNNRPHYHICLFNYDFNDKIHYKDNKGYTLYISPTLQTLWGKGICTVGELNFETAAYTARYIMKKVNGEKKDLHYSVVEPHTGEIMFHVEPEFTNMSRGGRGNGLGGIGNKWFEKWWKDTYPDDTVIMKGKAVRPPRYYDNKYEVLEAKEYNKVKQKRRQKAAKHYNNNTPERLEIREKVMENKLNTFTRKL